MEKHDHEDIFVALAMPFDNDAVKTRAQAGRTFSYVTARTVMNRLDETVGPANWWDDYTPTEHGAICRLTIRLPDGSLLTKVDAGGDATMQDEGDNEKAGFSDAFKRVAVKFGIGRYLYRDGVPEFARDVFKAANMEDMAYPSVKPQEQSQPPARSSAPSNSAPARSAPPAGGSGAYGPPRSGKALFAWCKQVDDSQKYEYSALATVNDIGQSLGYPDRMVDWNDQQVKTVYDQAVLRLTGN